MDGNYSGTLGMRIEACDTVIFLDIARTICLRRVFKRALLYRNRVRPDMAQGCNERLSFEFVRWIWDYPKSSRPKILKLLEERAHNKNVFRLRTQAEVEKFLTDVGRDE